MGAELQRKGCDASRNNGNGSCADHQIEHLAAGASDDRIEVRERGRWVL